VPELYEFKIITKSDKERWVERGAIAIELKEKPFVLVTVIDIWQRGTAIKLTKINGTRLSLIQS